MYISLIFCSFLLFFISFNTLFSFFWTNQRRMQLLYPIFWTRQCPYSSLNQANKLEQMILINITLIAIDSLDYGYSILSPLCKD